MRISDWSSDVFSSDLSIPAALAVAHGALARIGVLALRPDALETLADASDVVFDKTRTLSDGRPRRAAVETFEGFEADTALRNTAHLERDRGPPIANHFADRKRVVGGKRVSVRGNPGGRRSNKKKK